MRVDPERTNRCERCVMVRNLCICSEIPSVSTQTRVTILMHFREIRTTTNTGRLSNLCLPNSQIVFRGVKDSPVNLENLVQSNELGIVLQLCEEAVELNTDFLNQFPGPYHLIVPDGNWRQAMKMHKREPALKKLMKVRLSLGSPSRYRLRREHMVGGLATHEAIARALGILDGPQVQTKLENIFELMVNRTLTTRPHLLKNLGVV